MDFEQHKAYLDDLMTKIGIYTRKEMSAALLWLNDQDESHLSDDEVRVIVLNHLFPLFRKIKEVYGDLDG